MRLKALLATSALALFPIAVATLGQQSPLVLNVDLAHPGAGISPGMFGVFFEDINFGADGGLYPERIKNRSFEFPDPLVGWRKSNQLSTQGELAIRTQDPLNAQNPHYLRVRAYEPGFRFINTGFRGIGLESGQEYRFSAYVRSDGPKSIEAILTGEDGKEIGRGTLTGFDGAWKQYEVIIRPTATVQRAQFNLVMPEKGAVDLDLVSMFPVGTWKNRKNGLRKDLVQLLYDMHPGFIRFPGGCIVEGKQLPNRYRWKATVGDISQRQTIMNRWNNEFEHKPAPDYYQSFGLGFYEYFQLAEDLGASPLPILNCGMACQFNSSETAPMSQIDEFVQDALDLIEFANGPATTKWGKLRAQMGHPEPFHLKMIGVGNEQWGPQYVERYKAFAAALKPKHPDIQLVVSAGPFPTGKEFDYLWTNWRELKPDIVDEHYYQSPEWFLSNTGRYDHYDRSWPKVFAGEFAAHTSKPDKRNNWNSAMAEAAFMTGLERNADVVRMASYAPLFAHVDAWQWAPDAIWFDNLRSYGTPNYYVQSVFANNVGTRIVPITPSSQDKVYVSASLDDRTHELIVKAVNATPSAKPVEIRLAGSSLSGTAKVTTLSSSDLLAENTLDQPKNVAPKQSTLEIKSAPITVTLQPYSLTVYRFPAKH